MPWLLFAGQDLGCMHQQTAISQLSLLPAMQISMCMLEW